MLWHQLTGPQSLPDWSHRRSPWRPRTGQVAQSQEAEMGVSGGGQSASWDTSENGVSVSGPKSRTGKQWSAPHSAPRAPRPVVLEEPAGRGMTGWAQPLLRVGEGQAPAAR